jgi:hypothetical protein
VLRRTYDAPIEDVWDACSDPDRLKRWFSPVSGDLRLGGRFQIEGNAALEQSPEVRRFVGLSSAAWGAELRYAGVVTAAEADAIVERTTAFYAPEPGPGA